METCILNILLVSSHFLQATSLPVESLSRDLAEFVKCNADYYVNIISISSKSSIQKQKFPKKLVKDLSKYYGLRSRHLDQDEVDNSAVHNGYPGASPMLPVQDFSVFIFPELSHYITPEAEMVNQTVKQVSKLTRVRKSMVLIPGNRGYFESFLTALRDVIAIQDWSTHFFIAYFDGKHSLRWHQALTVRGQKTVITNELKFIGQSLCIHEDYDLQGLNVTSVSLSWTPYLTIEDCDIKGRNCDMNYGALIDLCNMVGRMFNLAVASTRDPDSDWGVTPKSGPYDYTGEWGGVMGKVINGDFPISLSEWLYLIERNELMDFVVTSTDYLFLALTPQPAPVDLGVFTRPFKPDAWALIASTIAIILAVTLLPYIIFPNVFEETQGYRMIHVVSMLFFVLVNSFYGGAMTMFFTSEIALPFESMRDVMRDQSWKLVVQQGNEVNYQFQTEAGDPDYIKLWERIGNEPEDTVFQNVEEGLAMLREDRNVMHVYRGILQGYFRNNPFHQQRIHTFGQERPNYQGIILTKNSPLTPVFKLGTTKLRENSVSGQIYSNWEGRGIKDDDGTATSKVVLSAGQVIMLFIIVVLSILLSLLLLLLECCWIKSKARLLAIADHFGLVKNTEDQVDGSEYDVMIDERGKKTKEDQKCLCQGPRSTCIQLQKELVTAY